MGGIAVAIDWDRPVTARGLDRMIALMSHRASHGVNRASFDRAALVETRSAVPGHGEPAVETVGPLSIVGDLRLWNRQGLRSRAGGESATKGMGDRRLLLTAYQRTGIGFLDSVDGDFAFVIWDNEHRRVVAVRDRFGTKPLFFDTTPTGIRFASEPKQLAMTSERTVQPSARSVAEYLDDEYSETRYSFFEGVERVRPSTALVATDSSRNEHRYWSPSPDTVPPPPNMDVAAGFRERLADAVQRRVGTSTTTISHLTGGLDSPSIAASAHLLSDRSHLAAPFHTVSAVFPNLPGDESMWIDEIVAGQPFPHHDFEPRVDGIDAFDRDMWDADQPRVHRIRGMWTGTASVASAVGADLVLTGSGGDQILDQDQLAIDRLGTGPPSRRIRDARALFSQSPRYLSQIVAAGGRDALPASVRRRLRGLVPRRRSRHNPLASASLLESLDGETPESGPYDFGFPAFSQSGVIAETQHASVAWFNEIQEAEYTSRGLDVSHPFLDRAVVEYLASIPIGERPFDGRTKTLVRNGFAGLLPDTVLNRRTKTISDGYLDRLFVRHGAEYRDRYPEVTETGRRYLDPDRYREMLAASTDDPPGYVVRESLWNAWTLMAWLHMLRRRRG